MPISLKREQKTGDIVTIQCGSKYNLSKVCDPGETISVELDVVGQEDIDFVCFSVDSGGHAQEPFCIFYSQPRSPGNEISLKDRDSSPALFRLELSRLPKTIKKLIFTASVRDSGPILDASDIAMKIRQNNAGFHLRLSGRDFSAYKSIIIVELSLGSVWQLEATATGFNGDLGRLVNHFGLEIEESTSQNEVSAEPVVQRDGKIWIDGEEFAVDPENDWV
jgi:tellurite resistance protein TerA